MKIKSTLLILSAAFIATSSAQAAYYVNDDAPVMPVARANADATETNTFVHFSGVWLTAAARTSLETITNNAQTAEKITVTAYAQNRPKLALAQRRITTIKNWLTRNGIPEAKIQIYSEIDPENDPNDTEVQVTLRGKENTTVNTELLRDTALAHLHDAPVRLPASIPTSETTQPSNATDTVRMDFIRRIMSMAQSKMISQENAYSIISAYLNSSNSKPAPAAPSNATITQLASSPSIQIAPLQIVSASDSHTWILTGNKSLRDNLNDWAKTAGYNQPNWTAANPYQVTFTSSYTGSFLDVLGQIATAVPALDFNVSKGKHTVDVADVKP